jgi:hypothetical protein
MERRAELYKYIKQNILLGSNSTKVQINFATNKCHKRDTAFIAQADRTVTHTSHKDTEQSTLEASITLDGVTMTDQLIR